MRNLALKRKVKLHLRKTTALKVAFEVVVDLYPL